MPPLASSPEWIDDHAPIEVMLSGSVCPAQRGSKRPQGGQFGIRRSCCRASAHGFDLLGAQSREAFAGRGSAHAVPAQARLQADARARWHAVSVTRRDRAAIHRATAPGSRLHYDFRLEIDGVLVSWAVPKGPTLDPRVRRAAFHVEDHPLDYIDFEGIIPAREYGGGDVIVWDTGTWSPDDAPDPGSAVRDGECISTSTAQALGRFVLVRTRVDSGGKEEWLLLHKHDEYAVDGWVTEDHPQSVVSGRTNDEVKANPERTWRSNRSDGGALSGEPAAQHRPELGPASGVREVGSAGNCASPTWTRCCSRRAAALVRHTRKRP